MDISKTLTLFKILLSDEEQVALNDKITNLNSLLSQGVQDNTEQIESSKSEIFNLLENSQVSSLPPSYLNLLENLNGYEYFGEKAKEKIVSIIHTESYKIIPELEAYRNDRQTFLDKIGSFISSSETLGIQSHSIEEGKYEIGIIIPREITDLKDLSDKLSIIDRLIKKIAEINNEEVKSDLSLISTGSWEFYVFCGVGMATSLMILLNHIADFIKKIEEIKKITKETETISNDSLKKGFEEAETLAYENMVIKCQSVINEFDGNKQRKEELKNYIRLDLKNILREVKKGIQLEVISKLDKETGEVPEENGGKPTQLNISLKLTNRKLVEIYSLDKEVLKLPEPIEKDIEDSEIIDKASEEIKEVKQPKTPKK